MEEEEYNPKRRRDLIDELETLFEAARLFRRASRDVETKELFWCMQQLTSLKLLETKLNRYTADRLYHDRSDERVRFVEDNLDNTPRAKYNDREFRIHYRMSRPSFLKLWHAIKDDDAFKTKATKKGVRQQANSKYQLLVLLKFLGTEGDGMSNQKARAIFPSSAGAIDEMKNRVIDAIIRKLSHVYFWPRAAERLSIAENFKRSYFINQCVGIGDGTLLPLAFKPQRKDYTDFNGRKGGYTLTMFIICDHLHRIHYYHAGWPGNVHDERVFRNSSICKLPANYFSPGEYMLSHSAVAPRAFVVPQYKKNYNQTDLPTEKIQFNCQSNFIKMFNLIRSHN